MPPTSARPLLPEVPYGGLVLERMPDEAIFLDLPMDPQELVKLRGARLVVKLVEIRPFDKAVLRFECPKSIRILREEVEPE